MSSREMPFKTLKLLLVDLERQGCTTKETKAGYLIFFPNGTSTAFHKTPSDIRAIKNMRARVLMGECTWLLDGETGKKKSA